MKIAIDIQTTLGQKSGFGYYVKNLVENLENNDSQNEYFLATPETEHDFSTPQRLIWDQFTSQKSQGEYFTPALFFSAATLLWQSNCNLS
jgi:hypothetical protein